MFLRLSEENYVDSNNSIHDLTKKLIRGRSSSSLPCHISASKEASSSNTPVKTSNIVNNSSATERQGLVLDDVQVQ